jgi:GINS complex subunit 1
VLVTVGYAHHHRIPQPSPQSPTHIPAILIAILMTSSTSSFPSSGRELLLELKRSNTNETSGTLAPYNVKLVRTCFQDLTRSFKSLREEMQATNNNESNESKGNEENDDDKEEKEEDEHDSNKPSMNARPSILLHNASIQRQKRCLLTYHKHRMDRIQESTGTLSNMTFNNAHEEEFASDYQELRESYAAAVFELGLLPPTSHMVQVRVLEHLGQVVLESGRSVTLAKGSSLYLPRSDVLEFLQAGSLELCDGEEVDF